MSFKNIRSAITLAAAISIASCAQHHASAPEPASPAGTVLFRNQSRDRIQVYLAGEKEDWLLGRLESLETAHLRLPESPIATAQKLVLVVVPDWSRTLEPRRAPRAILSIKESSSNLPGEEWIFVGGQLQGPLRARSHGRS